MLLTIILCTLTASIFNGIFYFLVSFFILKKMKAALKETARALEKLKNIKKDN